MNTEMQTELRELTNVELDAVSGANLEQGMTGLALAAAGMAVGGLIGANVAVWTYVAYTKGWI